MSATPDQYETADGTILEQDDKGRVKNPTTNRFTAPTGKTFKQLLKAGTVKVHERDSIVTIELAKPGSRGRNSSVVIVRVQATANNADLAALRKLKVFDPESALANKFVSENRNLFSNLDSIGPLPIVRITSRKGLQPGFTEDSDARRFKEDVEIQPHLCCEFVKGGLPMMEGELKELYRADACSLNLLLVACGQIIPKKYRSVEALAKLAKIPAKHKYSANLNELKTLSDEFCIKMTFVRTNGKLIRKYTPPNYSTRRKAKSHYRAVVDGHHLWLVTENIHRFDQVYGERYIAEGGLDCFESTITMKPSIPERYKHVVKTADDIIAIASSEDRSIKDTTFADGTGSDIRRNQNAVCSGDLELLIAELRRKNVRAGDLRISNGVIMSFGVIVDNTKMPLTVRYVDYEENQPDYPEIDSVEQANLVADYLKKAETVFLQDWSASDYDEMYLALDRHFPKIAICGTLKTNVPELCAEFDQSKAYSTVMRNITKLPIFSVTTPMYNCTSQETEPCCFYYVNVSQTDLFCAPTERTFMYVDTVKFLRSEGVVVELLAVYRPIKIKNCNMREFVRELYSEDKLTMQNKKSIMNITYGRAGKRKMKSTAGLIYDDETDACLNSHKVFELIDGLYCGYTEKHFTFKNGFHHMARIILENHRITLYRMAKVIGIENILAIRTDAFYVRQTDANRTKQALKDAGFEFGKLAPTRLLPSITLSLDKEPPSAPYKYECQEHGKYEFADQLTNEIVEYELADEYSTEEVAETIKKSNAVFSGAYAGVGKTTTAILYCERNGLTYKIATPYGRLRTTLKSEKHDAYTMDRFLGISQDPRIKFGPISTDGVDVVIFDEVYLCDEIQLTRLGDFIKERPKVQFICTGDEYQLPPVGCTSSKTLKEARDRFFNTYFAVKINLRVIKRITDDKERAKMMAISDYLKDNERFDPLILEQFDHVNVSALNADAANFTHITKTNDRRAEVNGLLEMLVNEKIKVGDLFLSVRSNDYVDYDGVTISKNLNSQDEYRVSDITDDYIEFRGKHLVRLSKNTYRDYMNRPYAITCNSAQGLSCGDIIYIHETDKWISNVWLRTAITRCGTFKGVRIVV